MNSLTSRERVIVFLLASGGLSNKDVGRRLNLSEGTVKVHLHNIFQKLGVKTRTALVVLAHTEYASVRARFLILRTSSSEEVIWKPPKRLEVPQPWPGCGKPPWPGCGGDGCR